MNQLKSFTKHEPPAQARTEPEMSENRELEMARARRGRKLDL
jgi:hypothetical protein